MIALWYIGGCFAYLFLGGVTYHAWVEADGEEGPPAELCACLWPLLLAGVVAWYMAKLTRVVALLPFVASRALVASRSRPRLPEARLIKRDP